MAKEKAKISESSARDFSCAPGFVPGSFPDALATTTGQLAAALARLPDVSAVKSGLELRLMEGVELAAAGMDDNFLTRAVDGVAESASEVAAGAAGSSLRSESHRSSPRVS